MTDTVLIQSSEMALVTLLALLIFLAQRNAGAPQYLASVGWHGGKKR
jgi:hypothetical protein